MRLTDTTLVADFEASLTDFPGVRLRPALAPLDHAIAQRLGMDRLWIVEFGRTVDADTLAARFEQSPGLVESVEFLAVGRCDEDPFDDFDDAGMLPDDPLFPQLWGLENTGQSIWGVTGKIDADIDASQAWLFTRGSEAVRIAVIDSGVSLDHPDLAGQLIRGRNFTSADTEDYADHYVGHGTHVAGIIGALLNNGLGVAGVAPDSRIMPIRVIDRFGFTAEEWVAAGIVYAVDHGAVVLNISVGFPSASAVLHDAVRYAVTKGAVICASSGNIATDPIGYPARYPETIAVGASNNLDEVASFTSTGPEMTLVAPGRDIYSTWDTAAEPDTYKRKSGTSFAAPYVAGTVALVRSANPSLTPAQVRSVVVRTAEDLGPIGWDEQSGAGRLNAYAAVRLARSLPGVIDPHCVADMNADGVLTFFDVQIFLQAYASGDPQADLNHDHLVNFYDIQAYLALFSQGCEGTGP